MRKTIKSKFQLVSANFRFRAEWKMVTSRAKILSARAMARASSAQTHHYYLSKFGLERGKKILAVAD